MAKGHEENIECLNFIFAHDQRINLSSIACIQRMSPASSAPTPAWSSICRYLEAMAGENAPRPLSRTGSCTPLLAVSGGEATSDRQSSTSASATRTTRRETSGVKSSAEAKYAREYDARLNPFDAFQRRERQARYNALSPAEKLLLAVSSMLFSDRRARIAFFIYIVRPAARQRSPPLRAQIVQDARQSWSALIACLCLA